MLVHFQSFSQTVQRIHKLGNRCLRPKVCVCVQIRTHTIFQKHIIDTLCIIITAEWRIIIYFSYNNFSLVKKALKVSKVIETLKWTYIVSKQLEWKPTYV
jgi:hypothetical protein